MTKDALITQYQEIEEQMRGINPKLSLYKDLERKLGEVQKRLGDLVVEGRRTQCMYVTKKGDKHYFNTHQKV